jgi:hypothetical protein
MTMQQTTLFAPINNYARQTSSNEKGFRHWAGP